MNRRYNRPRIRQVRGRGGRTWVYHLRCSCGWTDYAGGRSAAMTAGDEHWKATHQQRRAA